MSRLMVDIYVATNDIKNKLKVHKTAKHAYIQSKGEVVQIISSRQQNQSGILAIPVFFMLVMGNLAVLILINLLE